MIEISLWVTLLVVTLGWIGFRAAVNLRTKAFNWKVEALQLLFLVNLLVLARMVFHPFATVDGRVQPLVFEAAKAWPFRVNFVPFVNLLDYPSKGEILLNLVGNSTMFIPTGILAPLLYKRLDSFRKTVLCGFLLSLSIEILQLPFAVRCSDVDDLILNTLGCAAGYGILALIRTLRRTK